MRVVVDASMALSWVLADEFTERSQRALEVVSEGGALVPALWPFEVANGLRSAERRGRLTDSAVRRALLGLAGLAIDQDDRRRDAQRLIDLAREVDLTVYDAAYLALAIEANLPLAALDNGLERAARQAGVDLL